jgi:hypothetical protein
MGWRQRSRQPFLSFLSCLAMRFRLVINWAALSLKLLVAILIGDELLKRG